MVTKLCAAIFALTVLATASSAAVFNLEFDTDGDFSSVEGVGTISVDNSLFTGAAFSVLTNDPLVTFSLNLGGLTYDTGFDRTPFDSSLLFDAAGNFVGTDDATGSLTDVIASSATVGFNVKELSFDDNNFGTFLLFDFNTDTGAFAVTGSGTFRIVAPVPVPAGLPLVLTGFGVLGLIARRRRSEN